MVIGPAQLAAMQIEVAQDQRDEALAEVARLRQQLAERSTGADALDALAKIGAVDDSVGLYPVRSAVDGPVWDVVVGDDLRGSSRDPLAAIRAAADWIAERDGA